MRRVKAEGGWAVVCTEQVEIHPTSDITPFIELRIWDDQDLPALERIATAIHDGGALAGIELAHNGMGASWRRDGVGRWHTHPMPAEGPPRVLTPDDLMAGQRPAGSRVPVFDDDHYYLGGVLAELLAAEGYQVRLVTPAASVSDRTANTLELVKIRQRLMKAGVTVQPNTTVLRLEIPAPSPAVFSPAKKRPPKPTLWSW